MGEPKLSKVTSMADKKAKDAIENDEPDLANVLDMLKQTTDALKSGKVYANKIAIILLQDDDNYYFHQMYSAGLLPQEGIALCELAKDDFKEAVYAE